MKIRVRDVVSHLGRDYVVEAVLTYALADKPRRLARAVDGSDVIWVEPLMSDADDRLVVLREVRDLEIATPPPQSIQYRGNAYLPRIEGVAEVEIAGKAADRQAGPCRVWRYRGAGDLFLQIEDWSGKVVVLHGEAVHKGMIDILPAR